MLNLATAASRRHLGLVACALLALSGQARGFNAGLGEPPLDLDRSSPYATVVGFLSEARAGHLAVAAQDLWLDHLPVAQQAAEGARLAGRLRFVLDRERLDLAALSKEGAVGPSSVALTTLELDEHPTPVRLVRLGAGNDAVWLFSRDTVGAVDALYREYGPPFGEHIPHFLFATRFGLELWQWVGLLLALALAVLAGWLGEKVVLAVGVRLTQLTRFTWDTELVRSAKGPLCLLLGILTFRAAEGQLLLTPGWRQNLGLCCRSLSILATTWFVLRALDVTLAALQRTLVARGSHYAGTRTQLTVLWRVLTSLVYLLGFAALLMQFTVVRTVGVSLLASAGVAGVVIGLAAQKSLGALFSGLQLSISQPIRIGEKLVVEGESGTVVEISLSHVMLRLWDNRHLLLPVSYFLEKPFQNWSRGTQDMVGVVFLQLDYGVDVTQMRAEFDRILQGPGKALWNGGEAKVQVTDTADGVATLRFTARGKTADDAFDLRCLLREEFLTFLRAHPEWLPTQRVEHRPPGATPSSA